MSPDLSIGISPLGGMLQGQLDASSYCNGGGVIRKPSGWVFSQKSSWKQAALDSHAAAALGCMSKCWVSWLSWNTKDNQSMMKVYRNGSFKSLP